MHALSLPANRGLEWLAGGFRLFAKSPLVFIMLIAGYFLIPAALSMLLPFVGPLLAIVLSPALWVGLMQACRELDRGEPIALNLLFAGFKSDVRPLLWLGLALAFCSTAILLLSTLIDDGDMLKKALNNQPIVPEQGEPDVKAALAIWFIVLLSLPMQLVFLFAPVLSAWHRLPPAKSLFFSVIGLMRNLPAFLVWVAALFACVLALGLFDSALRAAFGEQGAELAALVEIPVLLVLGAVSLASNYLGFRDIFREDPAHDGTTANP